MTDLLDALSHQIPEGIRGKLRILVMPYLYGELPDVTLSDGNGRQWNFTLEEDYRIPELILLRLCVEV